MADDREGRERAWWVVSDFPEQVIGEGVESYKQQQVDEHGGLETRFFFVFLEIL